jgi:hypothetical protein
MQSNIEKKEAIRKFKEQKPLLGIYAVRCTATGRVWVGSARNLDANRNRTWFTLRSGGHIEKSLQQEWNAQGEPSFEYEILETLEGDLHPLAVKDLLNEKCNHWVAQLAAKALLPG